MTQKRLLSTGAALLAALCLLLALSGCGGEKPLLDQPEFHHRFLWQEFGNGMAGFDIGAVDRHIFSVLYVCESFLCDNIGSDHVCKVSGCFFLRQ